ncbi:hypothetical protein SBOR_3838 [Sclerotinia borealis F-4128]|uniref:C2H2-type domain-containing protein n=1 Tax=Sclerotinia borealis (strain F-4128) TaxID=1432307 RepID=W9CJ11_SCLBF|nr:hypothetical protein SBOR_3838 [Sclerotinia borealis F-4128]
MTKQSPQFTCDLCKKVFDNETRLRAHQQRIHHQRRQLQPCSYRRILPKPPGFIDNTESLAIYPATNLNQYITSPRFPYPSKPPSRPISPLSLDYKFSTIHGSNIITSTPSVENLRKIPPTQPAPSWKSPTWSEIEHTIDRNILFDPTSVSPKTASTYSNGLNTTLSFSPSVMHYEDSFQAASFTEGAPRTCIDNCDIPLPSIESPDREYVAADDTFRSCLDTLESFKELTEWDLNEL